MCNTTIVPMEASKNLPDYTLGEFCRIAENLGILHGYAPEMSISLEFKDVAMIVDMAHAKSLLADIVEGHLSGKGDNVLSYFGELPGPPEENEE